MGVTIPHHFMYNSIYFILQSTGSYRKANNQKRKTEDNTKMKELAKIYGIGLKKCIEL